MREEEIIIGQEAIFYNADGIRCLGRVYSYVAGEACGVRSIKIKPYTEEKFVEIETSSVELIDPRSNHDSSDETLKKSFVAPSDESREIGKGPPLKRRLFAK